MPVWHGSAGDSHSLDRDALAHGVPNSASRRHWRLPAGCRLDRPDGSLLW